MRPFLRRLAARSFNLIPAVLLLLASTPASALTTLCVGTGAELRQAVGTANLTADNVDIRIQTGTVLAGGSWFPARVRPGFSTLMSGGWNANCSMRTNDPTLTVLDGGNASLLMLLTDEQDPAAGSFSLSNLTMTRGVRCLDVGLQFGTRSVVLDRLIIRGCTTTSSGGGADIHVRPTSTATVMLRNSLIVDNQAGTSGGGGGVSVDIENAASSVLLTNNTIVNNRGNASGAVGGVLRRSSSSTAGTLFLRNNVIVGNTCINANCGTPPVPADLRLTVGDNFLSNNVYQALNGTSFTATGSIITGQPGFVGTTDFRPRFDSVLRNGGTNLSTLVIGTHDLLFQARLQEGTVDIGAYEFVALPNQAPLTVTAAPSIIAAGGTSTLSTSGGSGNGAVSYAVTAGADFCSVTGNILTGTAFGSCTVTATKAGDASFGPATANASVVVLRANQAPLTVVATPASIGVGGSSNLSTTGGSGTGAVSYALTAGAGFCSLSGSTVTGMAAGSCTVTATKAADAQFNAATGTVVITVLAGNDLQIAKSAPVTQAQPGSTVVYTLIVSNAGPQAVTGARLIANPPTTLQNVIWQCVQAGSSANCPSGAGASGTGPISVLINLPAGAHLRYDLGARVDAAVGSSVVSSASVEPPSGQTDPIAANNTSSHTIAVIPVDSIFRNGLEGGMPTLAPASAAAALRHALQD
ncbi:MAG: DUF11 domain-containing protein [Xanthomonadales bacterium]|jgi:uncharacterized repeat protein (TIGR01451 family)|nr:DUF11 domain-containing protein [Xanthomonadales bacterium]